MVVLIYRPKVLMRNQSRADAQRQPGSQLILQRPLFILFCGGCGCACGRPCFCGFFYLAQLLQLLRSFFSCKFPVWIFYFPAGESFLSTFLACILTLRIPLRGVRFFLADSLQSFCIHIPLRGFRFFFCLLPRSAAGTRTRKHKNSEHLCRGAHSAGFDESFFLNFRSVPRMCMFGRRIFLPYGKRWAVR